MHCGGRDHGRHGLSLHWYNIRDETGFRWDHERAYGTLGRLQTALEEYHKANGKYPVQLGDLKSTDSADFLPESDQVVDPWNNPYQYRVEGDRYTLYSLGRDGKRGGEGLDQDPDMRDLSSNEQQFGRLPPVGIPTLRQFAFECPTRGVMMLSALAGIFAFVACLITTQTRGQPVRSTSLIALLLTLAACFVTAMMMSALDVPSHH